ncbi:MAG: tryptophanase [Myxococcota bacterium]|jgi:tryptophanase|nr:tryptophanase [Myxococcota bacterium]
MRTIIEPFRIKSVEPIRITTVEQRKGFLAEADYNLFRLPARHVLIDLLTDSGTNAMSAEQWAGVMRGDESYAGAESFYRFQGTIRDLTGCEHVIPAHQGRAAERIVFGELLRPGDLVVGNTHFDTTRANIEHQGAEALDLPCAEAAQLDLPAPFKGDINLSRLEQVLREKGSRVRMVLLTLTNNSGGGQPLSLANAKAAAELCRRFGVPLWFDAARFAENAYLVKLRTPELAGRSPREIAREFFALGQGVMMSAKKDAIVNIGGFIAVRDDAVAQQLRQALILTEGFITYGGLAGRDLEAIAQGLEEVLDEGYLQYRIASIAYVGRNLTAAGVPILQPPGGHAVYLDAKHFLPHVPVRFFPGHALACALYEHAGVRGCEIGSLMFGRRDPQTGEEQPGPMELVRLAIPRRVYTQSHMDYVVEATVELFQQRSQIGGMRIVEQAPALRHFTVRCAPVPANELPR